MSIYRRDDSPFYWFKFKHRGETVRESAGTADPIEARRVEARRRLELSARPAGCKGSRTWVEAVVGYLDTLPENENKRNTRYTLKWLSNYLAGKRLLEIDEDLLVAIRDAKVREVNDRKARAARRGKPSRWATVQPSYINRIFTGVVSPILNYAKDRKWLTAVPNMPRLAEPKKDPVWTDRDRALALLDRLPQHQIPMVIFDLEVGWRRSNVTHLEWSQVDLQRAHAWVTAQAAKEGKGIPTPLSPTALAVLRGQLGKHARWVFPYRGRPMTQTSTRAFRAARDAAGLPPSFTWHSFRHTWASWHVQDGTPTKILQELGGWGSDRMPDRYAHLDGKHLKPYVEARVALEPAVLESLRGGTERGHAGKEATPRLESKPLKQKQSGNSSVGRAQPCQGGRPDTPPEESNS